MERQKLSMEKAKLLSDKGRLKKIPESWVDHIFQEFHGRFGNSFLSKWQTGNKLSNGKDSGIENAKNKWAEKLFGYMPEELKCGLKKVYKYPPSLDDFMEACRPQIDYECEFGVAIDQMRKRSDGNDCWENPAVYWAATKLGNDLMSNPYQVIKNRWKVALDDAMNGVGDGTLPSTVPEKLIQLPSPGRTTVPREESERRFAQIHGVLNKKVSGGR